MKNKQANEPEQSSDNALVSSITSMSELLATSLSSLKTRMTNSFTEIFPHEEKSQFVRTQLITLTVQVDKGKGHKS